MLRGFYPTLEPDVVNTTVGKLTDRCERLAHGKSF